MPNPHRAEIELEALGQRFKLRLDVDAICNAEAELDMGFGDIIARVLQRGANMRIARALLCAASSSAIATLAPNAPAEAKPKAIDHDMANEMLDFNSLVALWPQVVRLVALCLPPAPEAGDANPPVAIAKPVKKPPGDGSVSSPTG